MFKNIVSVYGKCDGVFISFNLTSDGRWECKIPADFTDGTYVVELYAEDVGGNIGFYTGKLYMCDCRFVGFEIDNGDYSCMFSTTDIKAVITC